MSSRARIVELLLGLGLASAAMGCDGAPSTHSLASSATRSVRPKHDSVAAIPPGAVQGRLRGAPFVVRDARYLVVGGDGRERVDLLLSDAVSREPCGELDPSEPARIWLRRAGSELPATAELRIEPSAVDGGTIAEPWQAHYQLKAQGRWIGHSTAAALVRLERQDASLDLVGSISVCFADGHDSCAAGAFVARYCPSEIDRPLRGVEPSESPSVAPLRPPDAAASARP